jgi:DNA anti-recombination protein RmuC
MAWTDERLEERFDRIDDRFDEVDRRFSEVDRRFGEVDRRFNEVDHRFDRVEGEILELRREMNAGFGALQATMNRFGIGTILGLVGLIGAVLIKGA